MGPRPEQWVLVIASPPLHSSSSGHGPEAVVDSVAGEASWLANSANPVGLAGPKAIAMEGWPAEMRMDEGVLDQCRRHPVWHERLFWGTNWCWTDTASKLDPIEKRLLVRGSIPIVLGWAASQGLIV